MNQNSRCGKRRSDAAEDFGGVERMGEREETESEKVREVSGLTASLVWIVD